MVVKDLISIVTPMYNGEKYIVQTIESVIGQTYNDWEMIIVDDGSKDHSPLIVEEYSQKMGGLSYIGRLMQDRLQLVIMGYVTLKDNIFVFWMQMMYWIVLFGKTIVFFTGKDAGIVYASYRRINEVGKEILKPFIVPEKSKL